MRRLAQPSVVTAAAIAAAASAVASLPSILLWDKRPFPVWFPEMAIFFCGFVLWAFVFAWHTEFLCCFFFFFCFLFFFCGFVLWAFVFAWHTEYTRRPIFIFRIKPLLFVGATIAGLIGALAIHWLLDAALRLRYPQQYPIDIPHWAAQTLFSLSFLQLFLLFAPFAWAMRLFRNEKVATWVTVGFSVLVLALKTNASPTPLPASLILALVVLRMA